MSNISLFTPDLATGTQKELFAQIGNAFGTVPNMFRAIGNSPAALQAMFGFFGALGQGKIGARLGEQIAVMVADINRCEYCLAAHTLLGQKAGLTAEDMARAQSGVSHDAKTQAVLVFADKLVKNRAQVSVADIQAVRDAGFNDQDIAEILAHVALNIFTNYTNVAFNVPVDFPSVPLNPQAE